MSSDSSTYLKVAASAAVGAALGTASIAYLQSVTAKNTVSPTASTSPSVNNDAKKHYPVELKEEMFSRVRTFFGDQGLEAISNSFVVVVGLGGVGSHCAHMIARSGVGRVRLIDFDQVTLSSLNRHAVATLADVGISKASAMKKHLEGIVPWCEIEAVSEMFVMKEADRLLGGKPDFVLDCIDDVNTKAELISYCYKNGIRVVTSMGAGGKADPTKLRIAPLSECINDPLAQKIKWKLKKHDVPADQVWTVFSVEKPVAGLLPLDEEQKNAPQDFGAVDYLRLRVIPVLGTSPSIFGQAMAAYALCQLSGHVYNYDGGERMSKNLRHKLRQVFKNNEQQRFQAGAEAEFLLNDEDVEFVVQQVWNSRCAITHRRFGGHIMLTLTRWHAHEPASAYNLVLIMQNEAAKLAENNGNPDGVFPPDVIAKINKRLQWAKRVYCEEIMPLDYGPIELYLQRNQQPSLPAAAAQVGRGSVSWWMPTLVAVAASAAATAVTIYATSHRR